MATEAGGMHPTRMLSCYFLHCPEYYISSPKIHSEGKESYVETMYVLTSGFLAVKKYNLPVFVSGCQPWKWL